MVKHRQTFAFPLALALLSVYPSSSAATKTWNGGSSGLWATGANWSGGTAPLAGDDLVFPAGATRFVTTNNFSPNRAFNSVTFLAPYTVHGQPLVLTNGLWCGHTNTTVEIRAAITIAGTQSFIVTNGPAQLLLLNTNLDLGVFGHVVKNAAPTALAVMGLQLGYLLGGSILIETVFSWPGTGFLLNSAIFQRDLPLLQGTILVLALFFVVLNLLVDVVQTLLDPRIARA